MESDESQYHAAPQTMGRIAHKTVDEKKTTNGKGDYSLNRKQFKKSDFVLLKSEYLWGRKRSVKVGVWHIGVEAF